MTILRPKKRPLRDGTHSYTVQLPTKLQKTTGLSTQTFSSEDEALNYILEVGRRDNAVQKQQFIGFSSETIDDLFQWYITTQEYLTIKPNSKTQYLGLMKKASESRHAPDGSRFGTIAIANVTRSSVRSFINHFAAEKSGHNAYHLVKTMRLIWNVALKDEDQTCGVEINPWEKQKVSKPKPRKAYWTEEQLLAFVNYADNNFYYTFGSMALFCFRLCQRPGDIRQLKWGNLIDGKIQLEFEQEKTGTDCWFELNKELQKRIDWHREVHELVKKIRPTCVSDFIFLNDKLLQPYDRYYYHEARKVMDEVGMPRTIRFGDFRRSGVTYLADRDVTEDQLMSITGHTTREGLSPYLHRSRKRAKQALHKVYGD